MTCKAMDVERKKFLPEYCCENPNTYKFNDLFNSDNYHFKNYANLLIIIIILCSDAIQLI